MLSYTSCCACFHSGDPDQVVPFVLYTVLLNISYKQTTAYHSESNGAVERLHRRLKDALRSHAAAATRSEELPFVLLGLRAQPKEETGLSLAEAVFGAPIVLPNEFLQNDELSVASIIKKCSKILLVPASSLPRHNSSTELPSELPAELLSTPLFWVRAGAASFHPLQLLYDGPYAVLRHGPPSFTIRVGLRDVVVAVSRLKACTAADATSGSLRHCGRPPGLCPGGPVTKSGSCFHSCWFLHLLFSGAAPKRSRNRWPTRRGSFCMPGTGSAFTASTDVVPVSSTDTAHRPLTSFPSSQGQSLGGALWRAVYTAGDRQTSRVYSTTLVQYLYISCYLFSNIPMLSYLLLRLLPQAVGNK